MAYNTEKLFEESKKLIKENKLFFISDLVALLPCSNPTFYEHFPKDSNKLNELKELINVNKVNLKVAMRKKWFNNPNATLQMGLYKLICSDEERKALSQQYIEQETKVNVEQPIFPYVGEEKKD